MTGPDEPPMHDDDVIGGLRALGIPAKAIARAMRRGDPEGRSSTPC